MKELGIDREDLDRIFKAAVETADDDFICEQQKHGTSEEFDDGTKARPKWFLIGKRPAEGKKRMTMQIQTKIIKIIKGESARLEKDNPDGKKRRQQGWKPWAQMKWNKKDARAFQDVEIGALRTEIEEKYGHVLGQIQTMTKFTAMIRELLYCSNEIDEKVVEEESNDNENEQEEARVSSKSYVSSTSRHTNQCFVSLAGGDGHSTCHANRGGSNGYYFSNGTSRSFNRIKY